MFWRRLLETIVFCCSSAHGYLPYNSSVYIPMEIINSVNMPGGTVDGLVMMGQPASSPGVHGNSALFDGVSAINLGWARNGCFLSPDLCPNGFALSAWIFDPDLRSGESYYISSGGQTSSSYGFALLKKPTTYQVDVKTKTHWYRSYFQMPIQRWNHVVVTWYDDPANPAAALNVYIDGSSVSTSNSVAGRLFSGSSSYNLITLGSTNNSNITSLFIKASIDELMFWDEWKSADFVSDLNTSWKAFTSRSQIIVDIFSLYSINVRIPVYYEIAEGLHRGTLDCLALCSRQELCLGVNWNGPLKICELFNVVVSAEIAVMTADWNVYVK